MRAVDHDGRTTRYRFIGRGGDPVLLFVHGSGGSHQVWGYQYRDLVPDFSIAAVDLSGHGGSSDADVTSGIETLDAYATDVQRVADDVGATVLVGNSLGSAVALHLALRSPSDYLALVLLGIGATLPVRRDLLTWLSTDFERALDELHRPDRLFHRPETALVERSKAVMRATGQSVTGRDFRTCHRFDCRSRLDGLTLPLLAFTGEHDRLTPPHYHQQLAAQVADGQWTTIPDAAHLSMLERPAAVNETIRSYLTNR